MYAVPDTCGQRDEDELGDGQLDNVKLTRLTQFIKRVEFIERVDQPEPYPSGRFDDEHWHPQPQHDR